MKSSFVVRLVIAGLAAAGLVAAGSAAFAQGPGERPEGGPGFGMHRPPMEEALGPRGAHGRWWNDPALVEKLKLTDEQRKSMDGILLDHREKLIDMRASVEKAELALEPLMRDDQPNESRILAQIDKVAQARAELEKANARFLLAIRSKLSPEQWKSLQAARSERMERRGMDRRGMERGPGRKGEGNQPTPPPQPGPGAGPQGAVEDPAPRVEIPSLN